jgi:tripartite-type tricarboxylate transporter receptor subunit TctC
MKTPLKLLLCAWVLALSAMGACAQDYPSKPIRVVVGFPPGSSIDTVSRIVLDDVRARTGATIVVDNRPGALGAIGIDMVLRARPDGYTLMPSSSATHSSGPHLLLALQKLDPVGGLTHLDRLALFDIAVVTSSAGSYRSAKALVDAGAARPDGLTFGYGSGTGQVGGEVFSRAAGIKARGVPYKSQPAAVADMLGGQVDFVASDLGAVQAFVKQGTLTGVALLADRRSTVLPDIPTAREAGIDSVSLGGWIGIDGPAHLPREVSTWWAEQLRLSLAVPAVREKLLNIGFEPAPLSGEAFAKFVRDEQDRWGMFVRQAGIQPE